MALAALWLAACGRSPAALDGLAGRALTAWPTVGTAPAIAPARNAPRDPPPAPAPVAPAFDAPYVGHLGPGDSWSIGSTSRGYLLGARRLEPGPGLAIRTSARERGAVWGTAAFVLALERAAQHVALRHPGSVLHVGDLGLEHGGAFAPHKSHASGRDVDLAFYVMDADGRPADGPAMAWVDADGRVTGGGQLPTGPREREPGGAPKARGAWFDAARNWALVEALLRDPGIQVQWIFVASHLEALLLAAARDAGVDPDLAARAAKVLQEPGDSSPHADHFHVRVYCGEAERLQGCLDAPPFHPWIDTHDAAVARWAAGLVPFLSDPRGAAGEEFRFALERLVRANATIALPHLAAVADHPDPATRALVADALDFLHGRRTPAAWARWRPEDLGD